MYQGLSYPLPLAQLRAAYTLEIPSVLYQYDGLEREKCLSVYTYLQPHFPSHIKSCIISMI